MRRKRKGSVTRGAGAAELERSNVFLVIARGEMRSNILVAAEWLAKKMVEGNKNEDAAYYGL